MNRWGTGLEVQGHGSRSLAEDQAEEFQTNSGSRHRALEVKPFN